MLIDKEDLKIDICEKSLKWAKKRAGNAKSLSLCEDVPRSIDYLAQTPSGSGHDCFLKGIVVYVDWNINKIIREQLLRYSFINVVSSQSLMHCFERMKEEGLIQEHINSVDDLPLSFKYWISFQTNYLQLKTIYNQRKNHKRSEWREFCYQLKKLPDSHFITGEKK